MAELSSINFNKLYTTRYDDRLKKIENINWLPYVGKDYPKVEKKVMAIGLSYAFSSFDRNKYEMHAKQGEPNTEVREWEVDSVRRFVAGNPDGKWEAPNSIRTLLLGRGVLSFADYKKIPKEEIVNLNKTYVVTNFIQNFYDDRCWEEIERSIKVLSAICEVLRPTHIVLFAKASHNLSGWEYVKKHKPSFLQTPHPGWNTLHRYYKPRIWEYQAVIQSWNISHLYRSN